MSVVMCICSVMFSVYDSSVLLFKKIVIHVSNKLNVFLVFRLLNYFHCRSWLMHCCFVCKVGAALRPAFTPETAPDVTAAACDVCCHRLLTMC